MPLHDLICTYCSKIKRDVQVSGDYKPRKHIKCRGKLEIFYAPKEYHASVHEKDKVVYFQGPNGQIKYPGRNNTPMPEYYKREGYERKELTSLQHINHFEKKNNVLNERAHFDSNGRDFTNAS